MPRLRIRYPLTVIAIIALAVTLPSTIPSPSQTHAQMSENPDLNKGFYLRLHAPVKLPATIPHKNSGEMTYVGPLAHIKACHNQRAKIKPLYPGLNTDIVKIN
ncbi:hypothetical protein [Candidatus Synchoanobacter obligatus]|uniref:Uncharacterized protein n=1 Tax=Candidatus Synchoanobacter obligatus TaxID=2919597 RepID=A0ABT1L413_9GAMM|nr:hypothetical protein [Candidatus Synchoanobacter obligatus]MCP8351927.1 hypothetical protein [Candidatus Synchoanobacter obligatus]